MKKELWNEVYEMEYTDNKTVKKKPCPKWKRTAVCILVSILTIILFAAPSIVNHIAAAANPITYVLALPDGLLERKFTDIERDGEDCLIEYNGHQYRINVDNVVKHERNSFSVVSVDKNGDVEHLIPTKSLLTYTVLEPAMEAVTENTEYNILYCNIDGIIYAPARGKYTKNTIGDTTVYSFMYNGKPYNFPDSECVFVTVNKEILDSLEKNAVT